LPAHKAPVLEFVAKLKIDKQVSRDVHMMM